MNIFFTEEQANHAQVTVMQLVKKRFFINTDGEKYSDFNYFNNEVILNEALAVQQKLFNLYEAKKEEANKDILDIEKSLGFSEPQVPKDRTIVQYNNYNSGFEIKSVLPLSFLLDSKIDEQIVFENILRDKIAPKTEDDFSPKKMRNLQSVTSEISEKVLIQWEEIQSKDNFENLCVVLMKSKFWLSGGGRGGDFAESKFDEIEKFPELLGYLFYQKSKVESFIDANDCAVFNTSRNKHVKMWNSSSNSSSISNKESGISYHCTGGYDRYVHFVAIF